MAPEIIKEEPYYQKVDMWSCGVMMYTFLCGYMPFQGTVEEIYEKIINCRYHFKHVEFKGVSKMAKDLVKALMCVDPNKRLSVNQALNHTWFKEESNSPQTTNTKKPSKADNFGNNSSTAL